MSTERKPIPLKELHEALAELPGWALADARISKEFHFEDFAAAFGFMTQIALICERMDHHPEWANVFHRVNIALTTHDAKGVTLLDLELAAAIEEVAARFAKS